MRVESNPGALGRVLIDEHRAEFLLVFFVLRICHHVKQNHGTRVAAMATSQLPVWQHVLDGGDIDRSRCVADVSGHLHSSRQASPHRR